MASELNVDGTDCAGMGWTECEWNEQDRDGMDFVYIVRMNWTGMEWTTH